MRRKLVPAVVLLAGVAALLAFPALADRFYLQLVSKIMIMAIFAMSLNLLVGCTGLVSLGHAAAFAIGLLVLRSSGVYFIMATLAFTQMFFYYVTGAKALGGSDGAYIYVKPDAAIFGVTPFRLADPIQFYYAVLVLMAGTYLALRVLLRSPFGHAIQGIRVNEHRMRALGFATFRYKLMSFVIAGGMAGLAVYFDSAQFVFVNPDLFGWRQSGSVLMMVILGGMGTLYGPILGAFALVLVQELLSDLTRHWLLPMGLFIILAVLLLPDGIGGLRGQLGAVRRLMAARRA